MVAHQIVNGCELRTEFRSVEICLWCLTFSSLFTSLWH